MKNNSAILISAYAKLIQTLQIFLLTANITNSNRRFFDLRQDKDTK